MVIPLHPPALQLAHGARCGLVQPQLYLWLTSTHISQVSGDNKICRRLDRAMKFWVEVESQGICQLIKHICWVDPVLPLMLPKVGSVKGDILYVVEEQIDARNGKKI